MVGMWQTNLVAFDPLPSSSDEDVSQRTLAFHPERPALSSNFRKLFYEKSV